MKNSSVFSELIKTAAEIVNTMTFQFEILKDIVSKNRTGYAGLVFAILLLDFILFYFFFFAKLHMLHVAHEKIAISQNVVLYC